MFSIFTILALQFLALWKYFGAIVKISFWLSRLGRWDQLVIDNRGEFQL